MVDILVRGPGSCLTSFEHDVEVQVNYTIPRTDAVQAQLVIENPETVREVASKLGFKVKLVGDGGGVYEPSATLDSPQSDIVTIASPDAYIAKLESYTTLHNVKQWFIWEGRHRTLAALLKLMDSSQKVVHIVEFWVLVVATPFTRDKAEVDMTEARAGVPGVDYEKSLIEDARFEPLPMEVSDRFKMVALLEGALIADFDSLKVEVIWRDRRDNIVRIDVLDLKALGESQMERELSYPSNAERYDAKAYWRANRELSSRLTVKLMPIILRAV